MNWLILVFLIVKLITAQHSKCESRNQVNLKDWVNQPCDSGEDQLGNVEDQNEDEQDQNQPQNQDQDKHHKTEDEKYREMIDKIIKNTEESAESDLDVLKSEPKFNVVTEVENTVNNIVDVVKKQAKEVEHEVMGTITGRDLSEEEIEKNSNLFHKPKAHMLELMRKCLHIYSKYEEVPISKISKICSAEIINQRGGENYNHEEIEKLARHLKEACVNKFKDSSLFLVVLDVAKFGLCEREANQKIAEMNREYRRTFEKYMVLDEVK
ncbi:unnamed protein product [Caenorhabditis angaria]|uniref:SPK domain-containing protein n=1 Tax=Caenorhabditis angaria TaxID=860376 RepID=A0A9P1N6X7_9PELO|nr:unnamed protein product [Caenorhabditis angaria]